MQSNLAHPPQSLQLTHAPRMTASADACVNELPHDIYDRNQPVAGIESAQRATVFIVNAVSPSAAARRSFTSSAAIPRSSLVAHSHALTRTASACRVQSSSHTDAHAARLVNSSSHYKFNSTPRRFHAGYMPILFINSSSLSVSTSSSTSKYKPNEPVAGIEPAQYAIESGVAGEQLSIGAGRDITIQAGQNTAQVDVANQTRSSGFLSSRTLTTRDKISTTDAVGSSLGGNTVILDAGRDLSIKGSTVIGDKNVTLLAKNDITITTDQNTSSSDSFNQVRRSGLMSGGGLSVFIGSKSNSTDTKQQSITNTGSTIGSIGGNVTIIAGNNAAIQGSQLLTPGSGNPFGGGDITVLAKNIQITDVQNTTQQQTETKTRQSGLTIALSSPLISAAETVINTTKAIAETKDSRAQLLGAASVGLNLYNNAKSIGDAGKALADGKFSDAGSISVSIGSSRSQSNATSNSSTSQGSTLAAGGNITIAATGAGKESNLLIQGSQIRADNNISLSADNQVTLKAGENTSESKSKNSSSSASIGLSIGANTGVTLSGSRARGNSDGNDISYTNTEVTAGNNLSITSGGSTALIGANVAGKAVNINVGKTFGGDLTIESLQDKSIFTEKSRSSGGSITIGPGGIPTGGSISAGKTNINSNFASVTQQSGIAAGDGGFNVTVAGNTALTGAVITSTQAAVDNKLNSFQTGTKNPDGTMQAGTGNLTITNINNTAAYNASGSSVTLGIGSQLGKSSAGVGQASGNAASTTVAGITGIAGDKTVTTGKDTTNALVPIFNAATVKADVNAQVTITAAFGQQASQAIGTFAGDKVKDLKDKIDKETDPAKRAQLQTELKSWEEGGSNRVALHTLTGALTGGVSGALGAGVSQATIPKIAEEIAKLDVPVEVKQGLIAAAGLAIGVAVGGTVGGAAALNATANNYLTHTELKTKKDELAACKSEQCKSDVETRWSTVSQDRNAQMVSSCATSGISQCSANVEKMGKDLADLQASGGDKANGYTGYTPEERNNIKQVMNQMGTNLEIMAALGNNRLGTTYSSPEDMVAAGILTAKEGKLLEASRANSMVDFLGAVILPSGTRANPVRSATKLDADEYIALPGKTASPPTGAGGGSTSKVDFQTQGIKDVDVMRIPDGVKMVRELEKSGLSTKDAIVRAEEFVASGSTPPVARPIDVTDKLVKIVPTGGAPSSGTGYWMTQSEFNALKADPAGMANKLGLPPGMHVNSYDVFQITPRPGALVFESTIAPTTVNGVASTTGGARQTIVVDRSQFTPPIKIGSVKVN